MKPLVYSSIKILECQLFLELYLIPCLAWFSKSFFLFVRLALVKISKDTTNYHYQNITNIMMNKPTSLPVAFITSSYNIFHDRYQDNIFFFFCRVTRINQLIQYEDSHLFLYSVCFNLRNIHLPYLNEY